MSLKAKLAAGFGALLAILVTMGVICYTSVQKLTELSAFGDKRGQGKFYAVSIDSLINNQKAEYRAFLLTNQENEISRYAENNRILAEDFDKLEATLSTDKGKELMAHYRQVLDEYHSIIDRVVELHRAGKQKQAIDLILQPKSDAVRADLGQTATELIALQEKLTVSAREEQSATESRTTLLISSLAIVGVVIGLVVATIIVRSITGGITRMVTTIEEVAANNLAIEDMEITSQDEVGQAGVALNKMKNNLRELIQSVASTAEHVASASEEISSSASQQAQGAETQKDQTSQVATAMQEMSSTVLQVSENSGKAAEASRKAAETARAGGTIVNETLTKMRAIAESVSGTARKVEELGKSSDQIGRIIGVIDDIADQTNLLALNAAIEAARGGRARARLRGGGRRSAKAGRTHDLGHERDRANDPHGAAGNQSCGLGHGGRKQTGGGRSKNYGAGGRLAEADHPHVGAGGGDGHAHRHGGHRAVERNRGNQQQHGADCQAGKRSGRRGAAIGQGLPGLVRTCAGSTEDGVEFPAGQRQSFLRAAWKPRSARPAESIYQPVITPSGRGSRESLFGRRSLTCIRLFEPFITKAHIESSSVWLRRCF